MSTTRFICASPSSSSFSETSWNRCRIKPWSLFWRQVILIHVGRGERTGDFDGTLFTAREFDEKSVRIRKHWRKLNEHRNFKANFPCSVVNLGHWTSQCKFIFVREYNPCVRLLAFSFSDRVLCPQCSFSRGQTAGVSHFFPGLVSLNHLTTLQVWHCYLELWSCVFLPQEEPVRNFRVGEHLEYMQQLEKKFRKTLLDDMMNISKPWKKERKLDMLGSIVSRLASPRKIWGEKKFGVKIFLSTQDGMKHPKMHKKVKVGKKYFWRWKKKLDEIFFPENKSCLKLPELPRSHISRGPATDRQPDGRHHRVTSRVAPCSSKVGQKKFKQNKFTRVNFSYWQCPSWE